VKAIITVIVAVLAISYTGWINSGTHGVMTFTVASKDDQASQDNGHQYMIFTTSGQALKDTDSFWNGKHDSTQVWLGLAVGKTYRCPVAGVRRYWPTAYKDILDGCKRVRPARHALTVHHG
jgi:hypothetical protein